MKKYLALCAALMSLCCFPLRSQDSEFNGFSVDLGVIPVFEGVVGTPCDEGSNLPGTFDLGNSNLFTSIEANLAKGLSFYSDILWMGLGLDENRRFDPTYITDLYTNLGRSDAGNAICCAYFDWSIGNYNIIIGKNALFSGGLEGEEDDWNVHPTLASSFWNNFPLFQWGAELDYTTQSGNTTFGFQFCTSPYGEYPFKSKHFSYGAKWVGDYGPLHTNWSFSYISTIDGSYYPLLSLGQRFTFSESFNIGLDYWNAICDPYILLRKCSTTYFSANWTPYEQWEVGFRMGFESGPHDYLGTIAGISAHYRPTEDLRLHFTFAANQLEEEYYYAAIGLVYNLNFHLGK